MTNSQIFKNAHTIAKNTVKIIGSYVIAFSLALKEIYANLRKPTIKSVFVFWSECGIFSDDTEYSFKEYTKLATQAAIINGTGGGYSKTKIEIRYNNGDEYGMRHDIGCDQTNLVERMAEAAAYYLGDDIMECMKPDAELKAFYQAIA